MADVTKTHWHGPTILFSSATLRSWTVGHGHWLTGGHNCFRLWIAVVDATDSSVFPKRCQLVFNLS